MIERRGRVLAGMGDEGIEVLLLGTGANLRYVTGARPLWLAGTRPFAPLALLQADGQAHVVANSDDGVPPGTGLIRASWNPATVLERLSGATRLDAAARIGVDGLSPLFEGLLAAAFPAAELVDATPILHRARATKTDAELALIRTATGICDAALAELTADLVGRTERELHARFVEQMAASGTTLPAFDGTFCVVDEGGPRRRMVSDRTVVAGDRVALDVGVLVEGYEGGRARTWVAGGAEVTDSAAHDALAAVLAACRPGVALDALSAAAPNRDLPVAYGVGLGVEPLSTEVGATACLQVLVDGVLLRDTVVMGTDRALVLG